MSQPKYLLQERISKALAGDKDALASFTSLGEKRDVNITVTKEIMWESLKRNYHAATVQWQVAKFLASPVLRIAAKRPILAKMG